MRVSLSLSAIAATLIALAACGDDDGTTTTTGTGGSGTGASGTGGTTSDGGGGAAPLKATGDACMTDAECDGGLCLVEEYFGWAGGYCTQLCDPDLAPCGAGETCVQFGQASSGCFKACDTANWSVAAL